MWIPSFFISMFLLIASMILMLITSRPEMLWAFLLFLLISLVTGIVYFVAVVNDMIERRSS